MPLPNRTATARREGSARTREISARSPGLRLLQGTKSSLTSGGRVGLVGPVQGWHGSANPGWMPRIYPQVAAHRPAPALSRRVPMARTKPLGGGGVHEIIAASVSLEQELMEARQLSLVMPEPPRSVPFLNRPDSPIEWPRFAPQPSPPLPPTTVLIPQPPRHERPPPSPPSAARSNVLAAAPASRREPPKAVWLTHRPPPAPTHQGDVRGGTLAYEVAVSKASSPPVQPPLPQPRSPPTDNPPPKPPSTQNSPSPTRPAAKQSSPGKNVGNAFLYGFSVDRTYARQMRQARSANRDRARSLSSDLPQTRRRPPPRCPPASQPPPAAAPAAEPGSSDEDDEEKDEGDAAHRPRPGAMRNAVVPVPPPPAQPLPEPVRDARSPKPMRPSLTGGAPADPAPVPAPEFEIAPQFETDVRKARDEARAREAKLLALAAPPPTAAKPPPLPPKPRIRKIPNDDTGVEILFQDANASDPGSNGAPKHASRTYRSAAIPQFIKFVIHVKTWSMGATLPPEVRAKVQAVKTCNELDSLTVGRHALRLHDVIGLMAHPNKSALSNLTAGFSGAYPDGAQASQVMPTLVVHVPSALNPGYLDSTIEFGPKSMSALHRPQDKPEDARAARPRVIVPLHLSRDHPAKAHSTRNPGPKKLLERIYNMPSRGADFNKRDPMPIEKRIANAANGVEGARPWSHGWLPFAQHAESATQAAAIAGRRGGETLAADGVKGGWRRFLRKDNGEGGKPSLSVDARRVHEPTGEIGGLAVPTQSGAPRTSTLSKATRASRERDSQSHADRSRVSCTSTKQEAVRLRAGRQGRERVGKRLERAIEAS